MEVRMLVICPECSHEWEEEQDIDMDIRDSD